MTQWTPYSLRQEGLPWPGQDTRGGRLDDGTGQLEDGSVNCMINRRDTLAKRAGFVRGLDEWFTTVVCGLFAYTDYCGRESLLVANETGIVIRTPFVLPSTTVSDAYPNDDFAGTGAIDVDNWRNTLRYTRLNGNMVQALGAAAFTGTRMDPSLYMPWFKVAGSFSYLVDLNSYVFDPALMREQRAGIIIRGNGDLALGALLQAEIVFNPSDSTYKIEVYHRNSAETVVRIIEENITGSLTTPRGLLSFSYERDLGKQTFIPVVSVLPGGGLITRFQADSLNRVEDTDLGFISAIALAQKGGSLSQVAGIEAVAGRAI